jgi:hypothetical protein
MNLDFIEINCHKISLLKSDAVVIYELQDAIDLLANSSYNEAYKIILFENQITPAFFDLKTKLAGDILQKFSNYRMQLAIVGDFAKYNSKSLDDFMYESNKFQRINFVSTLDEAKERLGR